MKIGIVYDLRKEYLEMGFGSEETAEFDSEETIDAVARAIDGMGHEACRIGHIYELTRRLALGQRWDLVFNMAEGLYGRNREAQAPALLEAFNIPYTFSDPLTLSLALDKAMAKKVLRESGVRTPDFFIISSLEDLFLLVSASEGAKPPVPFPLFVKPVSEGTGKGITSSCIVHSQGELENQARRLLARYNQPVLAEAFLPGREFTVGITGTGANARAVGVLEVKLLKNAEPGVYSYANKELCEERVKYTLQTGKKLVAEASALALGAYRALECRDAGRVDIKAGEDGGLHVLEVNPLAGLHPTHSDLPILCGQAGVSYGELIKTILDSALDRKNNKKVQGNKKPVFFAS